MFRQEYDIDDREKREEKFTELIERPGAAKNLFRIGRDDEFKTRFCHTEHHGVHQTVSDVSHDQSDPTNVLPSDAEAMLAEHNVGQLVLEANVLARPLDASGKAETKGIEGDKKLAGTKRKNEEK